MEREYERECSEKLALAKVAVAELSKGTGATGAAAAAQLLNGLELAIKQLEVAARTTPNRPTRNALKSKTRVYRADAKELRTTLNSFVEKAERAQLLASSAASSHRGTQEQTDRFAASTEQLQRSTLSLENSRRSLLEVEDVAIGITEQLSANRATIESSQRKAQQTRGLTDQARSVLRRLENMERRKRAVIYCCITFVSLLILWAVIRTFGRYI